MNFFGELKTKNIDMSMSSTPNTDIFSCFWSFWTNCPKKNFPQAKFWYLSGLGVVCEFPKIQMKKMKKMTFFLM